MLSLATIKALQVYGIAIVISMLVAILIKVMVIATSRVKTVGTSIVTPQITTEPNTRPGISDKVVAALSEAISAVTGARRIRYIAESRRSWSHEGRIAQHSHQPRH